MKILTELGSCYQLLYNKSRLFKHLEKAIEYYGRGASSPQLNSLMEQHNRVRLRESLAVCYFWWGEWKRSLEMMLEHLDGLEAIAHEINVESTMQRLFNPNKTAVKLNFMWISYQTLRHFDP